MVSTVTQDSAFLNLPLELRHQIYNFFICLRVEKIKFTSKALDRVTTLTGVSQQIRCEVNNLIGAVNTFHVSAGVFGDFTLRPLATATKIVMMNCRMRSSFQWSSPEAKRAFRADRVKMIQNSKDEIKSKEVPSQIKFWKVDVSVWDALGRVRIVANINFKEKEVCACRPGTVDDDLHDFKKAFIKAMQEFTKEEGFNGVTIQEVSRFLEQVTMPNPKGFWTPQEMFGELREAADYE